MIKRVALACALSLGGVASLQGQVQSVVGRVVDSTTGAPAPKLSVEVRPLHSGPWREAWTNATGNFYIAASPATDYLVHIGLPDGRTVVRDSMALADFAQPLVVAYADAERRHMYFEFEVDKTAVPVEQHGPRYPKGVDGEGEVLVQVAVDSTGRIDPATLTFIRSPHPLLTAAVQEALMSWRFDPARKGGRPVRQMVQIPFIFHR